ncbi:MAG: hypothetical protein GX195_02980 [Firmicutes bacterium]|nr:hypothetical protein [Bacillota bacterium]
MAAGNNGANQTFDTLLRVLPSIIAAYPAFMALISEQGTGKIDLTQVVTALPQILDEVRNATPEQLEQLLTHITETFPGLEGVLPQQGGTKDG